MLGLGLGLGHGTFVNPVEWDGKPGGSGMLLLDLGAGGDFRSATHCGVSNLVDILCWSWRVLLVDK